MTIPFSGEPVAKISKDTSATAFYAKWEEADRLTVTFDTGDETVVIHPVFRFPGDTLKRPIDPVRKASNLSAGLATRTASPFDFDSRLMPILPCTLNGKKRLRKNNTIKYPKA